MNGSGTRRRGGRDPRDARLAGSDEQSRGFPRNCKGAPIRGRTVARITGAVRVHVELRRVGERRAVVADVAGTVQIRIGLIGLPA